MTSPEENPNPARSAAAKAYHERRRRKKEAEETPPDAEWLELSGTKIVKKTKKNGRVYSVYACTRKQADERGLEYRK